MVNFHNNEYAYCCNYCKWLNPLFDIGGECWHCNELMRTDNKSLAVRIRMHIDEACCNFEHTIHNHFGAESPEYLINYFNQRFLIAGKLRVEIREGERFESYERPRKNNE